MGNPSKPQPSTSTLSGFTVIPVIYSKDATHYMYAKAHSGSGSKKSGSEAASKVLPVGRALFLVNVPPDATERELVLFFKSSGTVEKVVFDQREAEEKEREEALNQGEDSDEDDEDAEEDKVEEAMEVDGTAQKRRGRGKKGAKEQKPTVVPLPPVELRTLRKTGRTAYVVFLDNSSLSAALESPSKPRRWPFSSEPRGLKHYVALHSASRPPMDAIRAHAESAIILYDWEEEAKKQKSKYKKGEAIVDEDGFTLVVRGGAYGKTLGGGVAVATRRFERTGEAAAGTRSKKKEKKEKDGFYAFQKHEKRRQELIDLKKKWNEDLAKVEKLKHSRRFKPY